MSDSVWFTPLHPVDAEMARRSVLAQHVHIRGLLLRAQETATDALEGVSTRPDVVVSAIGDIRTTMEIHLAFEERVLVPLLDGDLPLGPERARRMLAEHGRQRAVLASLHREAVEVGELPTLSIKLGFLTSWLLADMEEEERDLLIPDVIRDDQITINQSSG
ncbi:MAG: hemerythrin domain-containing protein [Deltaproteobacteria bacterium]|nr:hemerythrin domain-containing protein [Deltaproteobacteria bacterium]